MQIILLPVPESLAKNSRSWLLQSLHIFRLRDHAESWAHQRVFHSHAWLTKYSKQTWRIFLVQTFLAKLIMQNVLGCGDAGMEHITLRRKAYISAFFVAIMFRVLLSERFRTDFYEVRVSDSGSNANFVGSSTVWTHVEPFRSDAVSQEITIKIVAAILVTACNRSQVQRGLDSLLRQTFRR